MFPYHFPYVVLVLGYSSPFEQFFFTSLVYELNIFLISLRTFRRLRADSLRAFRLLESVEMLIFVV